ncbi:Protein disulfide oxidoreductase domain protein [Pleurostoma richardsiae]|uniref:Protein disulfide oxidoreductase domain protein n=1 Tax=Pleurostoma richardsiae TaxID=41990 RepID=A0AA38RB76_9PEZI|nr:Protein disulfide oxidoreductase domain protein [Pleurostoma richardsiae]
MALPPKFKGHRLIFFQDDPAAPAPTESTEPLHTIELYLDYVCPYSAKLFKTFVTSVAPAIRADKALAPRVQVIFRQQVQPWHPSSTLVHEAALAVQRLAPGRFWAFSNALFAAQRDYFDVSLVGEPRNATYRRLAALAASSAGVAEEEVYALLAIPDKPAGDGSLNVGNGVTNDLKVVIKMARLVGVHVSPTVIFDGVVNNDISSGWTAEQWLDWLKKNVADA